MGEQCESTSKNKGDTPAVVVLEQAQVANIAGLSVFDRA